MGFFKKFLGDAADELKKNLDESRNEFMKSFDDMKKSASGQRQDFDSDDDEDDDEPKIKIGDEQDGVLTLFEGITEMDDESLEGYEHLRKIVSPASLERLYSDVAFVNAARNSNRETAQQQCNNSLMMIIAQLLSENTEFCRNYLDNPTFMNFINQRVFDHAYNHVVAH